MTETPNHEYNAPAKGTKDWHLQLNENFAELDADIEIRGAEADKGDYEPKEGAKFEATDSGAVYYGDGSSWVLTDRQVGTLHAEDVNHTLTPQENTLEAIQALVDDTDRRTVDIKLKPGVLYEGDTQLFLDSEGPDGRGRSIRIDAYGAGVHYTGDEDAAVQIRQGQLGARSFKGRVRIEHGSWYYGPNRDGDTAVIRVDDAFGAHVMPTSVRGAENGVLAVNNEEWCEAVLLGRHREGGYEGDDTPRLRVPMYYVRAAGGGSSFPDADGTNSFRDADVKIPWASGRDGDGTGANGGITFWQDNASFHGGRVEVRGFCPDGGSLYRVDGGSYGTTAHVESEGGDEHSTAVRVNTHQPPTFVNPRVVVSKEGGTDFDYSGAGWPVAYTNNGISKPGGRTWNGGNDYLSWGKHGEISHGTTRIHVPDNTDFSWDHRWLYLCDDDGDAYASVSPERNHLTFHISEGGLRIRDNEEGWMPVQAHSHTSHGNTGDRSHLGTFASHPNAGNGDTWYCDGTGTSSEGFYGQTSSGPVQLG
ncbi:hypothetical protein [Candidatus Halobonum tyrrellensis]|uniref:Uncharacterized protein n=1 Tax=Candidatus Halobonum tyrrellensis G22 TaxID=1324957 RepID=V4HH11_9EURY|nr:hypothetical protein [Candidatus Halobonum tyrrellensis]ESP90015.1 hypothetical protein K933_00592 [Candidatus Halobonum tyrrellensis G22]